MWSYTIRITCLILALFLTSSCNLTKENEDTFSTPKIVPAIEIKRKALIDVSHSLGVIGEVEPVYISPIKSPFAARIDTGAQTSSIDVDNLKEFERDGKQWVSFDVINRDTGEKKNFEKRVAAIKKIKRYNDSERRYFVIMDIKMGNQTIKEKFSLTNRDKFDYQVLIGRNVITGRAVVDTTLNYTLK